MLQNNAMEGNYCCIDHPKKSKLLRQESEVTGLQASYFFEWAQWESQHILKTEQRPKVK